VSPSATPLPAPAARQPLGYGGVIDEQKHPFTFSNHRNAACPLADVRYRGWGVSLAVMARRMRDQSVRQDQRAHLMDSHIKPINELVERLRDPDSRRWAPGRPLATTTCPSRQGDSRGSRSTFRRKWSAGVGRSCCLALRHELSPECRRYDTSLQVSYRLQGTSLEDS
jgi:hypothetical protein